jgi:hypothetical protein
MATNNMVDIHILGLRDAMGRFASMRDVGLREIQTQETEEAGRVLEAIYHSHAPEGATGKFRDSFHSKVDVTGSGFSLSLETEYPDIREYLRMGTKPHMPPVDAITPWAEMMGIDPWALAMSISVNGTMANPWEDDAASEAEPIVSEYGNRIGVRMVEGLTSTELSE